MKVSIEVTVQSSDYSRPREGSYIQREITFTVPDDVAGDPKLLDDIRISKLTFDCATRAIAEWRAEEFEKNRAAEEPEGPGPDLSVEADWDATRGDGGAQ